MSTVAVTETNEQSGGQAVSVLARAQDTADRILSDAQAQAQETIAEAQDTRASILRDTETDRDRLLEEAKQEAKRIRSEAEADAREQVAVATREGLKAAASLPAAVMAEADVYRAFATTIQQYMSQHVTLTQNLLKGMDVAAKDALARTKQAQSSVEKPGSKK